MPTFFCSFVFSSDVVDGVCESGLSSSASSSSSSSSSSFSSSASSSSGSVSSRVQSLIASIDTQWLAPIQQQPPHSKANQPIGGVCVVPAARVITLCQYAARSLCLPCLPALTLLLWSVVCCCRAV